MDRTEADQSNNNKSEERERESEKIRTHPLFALLELGSTAHKHILAHSLDGHVIKIIFVVKYL